MKINFKSDLLPHVLAILLFLIITLSFFRPAFFANRSLKQGDIQQHIGSTKDLHDYRVATGEEGLWASSIFGGMPAYLVSVDWSDEGVVAMKKVLALFLPHPYGNIFLAFVGYYIMLLAFRIRPYFAMAGAIAFGISSYMIIGLVAGHNARIGAIAFMPMVMAGIHLVFSGKRLLGFGVTTGAMALHLRENHLQMTYYLLLIVLLYGLVQLVVCIREKRVANLLKDVGLLAGAVVLASATFFGPFWAISEFTKYSYRGASDLVNPVTKKSQEGLSKGYAFQYSYGIAEPMTLLIPNFFGGSTSDYLVNNQSSKTYNALVQSGNQQLANQLAQATSAYWGPQQLSAPYYAGAIFVFLFVLGIRWADRRLMIWLVSVSVLSILLSWGDSFSSFNYFLFDHLPGYNRFRSVTFSIVMILFAIPLLGMLGLEKICSREWSADELKKGILWPALGVIGVCALLALIGGFGDYLRPGDLQLPAWFRQALVEDRIALLKSDAWRTFWLISLLFVALFLFLKGWIREWMFIGGLWILIGIDVLGVASRFITDDSYQRRRDNYSLEMTPAEKQVSRDTTSFRVYAEYDGHPSYFFRSTGGYSGARLGRYQELIDSCLRPEFESLVEQYGRTGRLFQPERRVLSMLNVKYFISGGGRDEYFKNDYANGPAWFVKKIEKVQSANEELARIRKVDTRSTAVIDVSKVKLEDNLEQPDSLATIFLRRFDLPYIKYESDSRTPGLAVFSEIHYPKGWHAFIDGKEVPILRADYVLRALEVPAGRHVIEFRFEPLPYTIGNKVTFASSWIVLLIVGGSLGWSLRRRK
ncbi:MAG: hypothetical protein SH819_13265 [Cytophagales bacterium]|nr:hypothetical protein [Cytophagales bacterium]